MRESSMAAHCTLCLRSATGTTLTRQTASQSSSLCCCGGCGGGCDMAPRRRRWWSHGRSSGQLPDGSARKRRIAACKLGAYYSGRTSTFSKISTTTAHVARGTWRRTHDAEHAQEHAHTQHLSLLSVSRRHPHVCSHTSAARIRRSTRAGWLHHAPSAAAGRTARVGRVSQKADGLEEEHAALLLQAASRDGAKCQPSPTGNGPTHVACLALSRSHGAGRVPRPCRWPRLQPRLQAWAPRWACAP